MMAWPLHLDQLVLFACSRQVLVCFDLVDQRDFRLAEYDVVSRRRTTTPIGLGCMAWVRRIDRTCPCSSDVMLLLD